MAAASLSRPLKPGALVGFLVLTLGSGALVSWVNAGDIQGWYESLAQPSWTAPNSWFAPVWAVLYVLQAIAAWLVWRKDDYPGQRGAISLFVVQVLWGLFWTVVFFQWHLIGWALAVIVLLWLLIVATTYAFFLISAAAGLLMLPYLLWGTYAVALNYAFWTLNR